MKKKQKFLKIDDYKKKEEMKLPKFKKMKCKKKIKL